MTESGSVHGGSSAASYVYNRQAWRCTNLPLRVSTEECALWARDSILYCSMMRAGIRSYSRLSIGGRAEVSLGSGAKCTLRNRTGTRGDGTGAGSVGRGAKPGEQLVWALVSVGHW